MPNVRFKVECPSCSVSIIVRSESSVGKKIECPKCKFRFVCPQPPDAEKDAAVETPGKSENASQTAKQGKSEKKEKKGKKEKGAKKPGRSKVLAGVVVGVLALGGLGLGALFFLGEDDPPPVSKGGVGTKTGPVEPPKTEPPKTDPNKKNPEDPAKTPPKVDDGKDITNLIPGEASSVTYVRFEELVRTSLFTSLFDQSVRDLFKRSMTFDINDVDRIVMCETGVDGVPFAVIRTRSDLVVEKLAGQMCPGKPAEPTMKGREYYPILSNAFLRALGSMNLEAITQNAIPLPRPKKGPDRPLAFCVYDARTLLIAEKRALASFLEQIKEDGYPPFKSEFVKETAPPPMPTTPPATTPPSTTTPPPVTPPPATIPPVRKNPNSNPTFRTIEPGLKRAINELEEITRTLPAALFVSQIDQRQINSVDFRGLPPEAGGVVTVLSQIRTVGLALVQFEKQKVRATAYVDFVNGDESRKSAEFLSRLFVEFGKFVPELTGTTLDVKSQVQSGETTTPLPLPMQPMTGVPTMPIQVVDTNSRLELRIIDTAIYFDALMQWREDKWRDSIVPGLARMSGQTKSRFLVNSGETDWNNLAATFPRLVEGERLSFPAGTLDREARADRFGQPYPPEQRISFFADLLPYLGKDGVRSTIQEQKHPWYAAEHLPAAETWVPEFLVPTYNSSAWRANHEFAPGRNLAATNYVGVAGLGRDAARLDPRNAANRKRLGMVGYDWGTKPADVTDGLSNTIYLMQVPPTLPRPWIAGGGSTIVGIDDTGDPFNEFATSGPNGQGTHILMADGSVRWVKMGIDPKVFRAMVTRSGDEAGFDIDKSTTLQKKTTDLTTTPPKEPGKD